MVSGGCAGVAVGFSCGPLTLRLIIIEYSRPPAHAHRLEVKLETCQTTQRGLTDPVYKQFYHRHSEPFALKGAIPQLDQIINRRRPP